VERIVNLGGPAGLFPHIWIPTRDGVRLPVAIHWPVGLGVGSGQHRAFITEAELMFESYVEQSVKSDELNFHWAANLNVIRNGEDVVERKWERSFKRELM